MPARGASSTRLGTRSEPSIQGSVSEAGTPLIMGPPLRVFVVEEAESSEGEQVVDLLDLLGVGHDEVREAAGRDHVGALAELRVEAAEDRVDRARVAVDDAGADRVDGVLAGVALGPRDGA